ncbi:MAG: lysophospholipase [Rhodospirillales bacterium]|nr:lysophospholipase [Rhodospirillales bacterium]
MARNMPSRLEVISRYPKKDKGHKPLLFVHGAFVGAWCWEVNFLDWFAERGYEVHALSLRGHNGSPSTAGLHGHSIADYVEDVASVAAALPTPPVIIGHSMGGFVAQKYMEQHEGSGMVLMASVPPTGAVGPSATLALTRPWLLMKVGLVEAFGSPEASADMMREAVFSDALPASETDKYIKLTQSESMLATLEMHGPCLPNILGLIGKAPVKVIGAEDDKLVAPIHVYATAAIYGVQAEVFVGMCHGMMLEVEWEKVCQSIQLWLDDEGL